MPRTNKIKWILIFTIACIFVNGFVCTFQRNSLGYQKNTTAGKISGKEMIASEEGAESKRTTTRKKQKKEYAGPKKLKTENEGRVFIRPHNDPEKAAFKIIGGYPEYIVGPTDILLFNDWLQDKLVERKIRVRPDGTISYTFIENIFVDGLAPSEIDELITSKLEGYVKHPKLDITVEAYNSKSASLFGEVKVISSRYSGPGVYALRGQETILDFLLRAGSHTERADLSNVEVTRGGITYKINMLSIFKGDDTQNIYLEDKDMVLVPLLPQYGEIQVSENRVYIFGEVNRPGLYTLSDKARLLDAISISQGIKISGTGKKIKVIRGTPEEPIVIPANLVRLLKKNDLSQNLKLQDGDIIYVARSTMGKVHNFIDKIKPILGIMREPASFRDIYTTGRGLRLRTGVSKKLLLEQAASEVDVRTLNP